MVRGGQLTVPSSGNPFPIRSTASMPAGGLATARTVEIVVAVVAILVTLGLVPGAR